MRLSVLLILFAALTGCASAAPGRWAPEKLGDWVDTDLAPYYVEVLTTHPRFAGESIRITTVSKDKFGKGNSLAISVRNRLERLLLDDGRIDVIAVQENDDARLNCDPEAGIGYFVAVEIKDGRAALADVRIYDLAEKQWVGGFGKTWRGQLTRGERRAAAKRPAGTIERGVRQNPYTPAETDLAAERLAHDLGCQLRASAVDEKTVALAADPSDPLASLIASNLSRLTGVRASQGDAVLKLVLNEHPIDGRLAQVWAVIDGTDNDDAPVSFTSSVYIRTKRSAFAARKDRSRQPPARQSVANARSIQLPEPTLALRAVTPSGACTHGDRWYDGANSLPGSTSIRADDCFAIEVPASFRIFVLNRDTRGRWSRLYPSACSQAPRRIGTYMRLPGGEGAFRWEGRSGEEIFQVVTVDDPAASGAISRVLNDVPAACGNTGSSNTHWKNNFAAVLDAHRNAVAFGEIRVLHAAPGDMSQVARR